MDQRWSRSMPRKIKWVRLLVLGAWVVVVLGFVAWREPGFWKDAPEHFGDAEAWLARGVLEQASRAVDRALRDDPDNPGYLTFKGHLDLRRNRLEAAESAFRSALRSAPAHADGLMGLADVLLQRGDASGALGVLARTEPLRLDVDQLRRRAQLWASVGDLDRARRDMERLLARRAMDPALRDELIALAARQGDWAGVLSRAEEMHRASGPEWRARSGDWKAQALRALGRPGEAYETYAAYPSRLNLRARADLALEIQRFDDAAVLYAELVQGDRNAQVERRHLAYALQKAGRVAAAEREYRALLESGAADPETRVRYGWLLNLQGRHAEAWSIVDPVTRGALDRGAHILRTRTALWSGRAAEAASLARKWLRQHPDDQAYWTVLAEAARQLDDDREALRALEHLAGNARSGSPARVELGTLLETAGSLEEAISVYRRAVEAQPSRDPELLLRLARLHRWTSRPAEAAAWYRRYREAAPDAAARRVGDYELSLALLDAGEAGESAGQIASLADEPAAGADVLLLAARAATAAGQPERAAEYLERLAAARPLSAAERVWRAGQWRVAGRRERALSEFKRLAQEPGGGDLWETIGDLQLEGNALAGALEAYSRIPEANRSPALLSRMAWVADRAQQPATAVALYQEALRKAPEEGEVRIALARLLAARGHLPPAAEEYARVVSARGAANLRVELARLSLGLQHFAEAERWAREAVAHGEGGKAGELVLAEALILNGGRREATPILRNLAKGEPPAGVSPAAWQARMAELRGYQLASQQLWAEAASGAPEAWLDVARVAQRRGNMRAASAALSRARGAGVERAARTPLQDELAATTRAGAVVASAAFGNSSGLSSVQVGAGFELWPADAARVGAQVVDGMVHQGEASFSRQGVLLVVDSLFLAPGLTVGSQLGVERHGDESQSVVGRLSVRREMSGGTQLHAALSRETWWSGQEDADPRQFVRVSDLTTLRPAGPIQGGAVSLRAPIGTDMQLRIEAGGRDHAGLSRQAFAYAHAQIPILDMPGRWLALRPNFYFETFDRTRPEFFSPESYISVGAATHAVTTEGRWRVEAEANPHVSWDSGQLGVGGSGLLDLSRSLGRFEVGVGAFLFHLPSKDYWQWRVPFRIGVRP
jgi:tetratricopeptide (TPR) repeat protein